MKIHEYQARALLAGADVPVPDGEMVTTVEDAVLAADRLLAGSPPVIVVKAQVHAGGRGKAGFVKVVHTAEEVKGAATFMLGNRMVSPQTPPEGLEVDRLLIAEGVDIEAIEYRVREIRASRWRKFSNRGRWCPKTTFWNLPNEDRVSIWASRRSGWCHLNRSSCPLLARGADFHLFVLGNPTTRESPVYAS